MISSKISISLLQIQVVLAAFLFMPAGLANYQARAAEPNSPAFRKRPVESLEIISFTLKDGTHIKGRVISRDSSGFKVSQPGLGQFTVENYWRTNIEPRTVSGKTVPANEYWTDMAEYFLGKVGDFNNDPDEFLQAIRCYERAKSAVTDALGPEHKLAEEIQQKIKSTKQKLENWKKLAKPRAELRKMELLSTLDQRLASFEQSLKANEEKIQQMQTKLAQISAIAQNFDKMHTRLMDVEAEVNSFASRLKRLEDDIYDLWRYRRRGVIYYNRDDDDDEDSD